MPRPAACLALESSGSPANRPALPPIPRFGLAKALDTTAQLWLNLQNDYDVQIAKRDIGKMLDRIETVKKPKAA